MLSFANPTGEPVLDDEYRVGQQIRFDPLDWMDNGYELVPASEQAIARRRLWQSALRKRGVMTKAWVLPNQLREYKSFGVDDGRVRNVYYLTVKSVA
jgi:hypothetical protein